MNNLATLQTTDEPMVLDKLELIQPKSGILYLTNNQNDFRRKKQALQYQNIPFTTDVNDGIFCLEW